MAAARRGRTHGQVHGCAFHGDRAGRRGLVQHQAEVGLVVKICDGAGDEADAADEAAARTVAFYTTPPEG